MIFKNRLRNIKNSWVYKYINKAEGISHRINDIAKREGITRAELARRLDVKAPQITQWLDPEANLTVKTIVRLADALGVDADEIFSSGKIASTGPAIEHVIVVNIEIPNPDEVIFLEDSPLHHVEAKAEQDFDVALRHEYAKAA